ncbi:MAG: hypothetical protein IJL34_07390 [Treponema sp.]|nr:hypothetical protein [Treponema sp.]
MVFAVFSVLALSGKFSFIEAKFYQPAVRRPIEQKISDLEKQHKQYTQILSERFAEFAADPSVASFTQSRASDEDVKNRSVVCARFFASSPYLLGVRIVDSSGRKIHYSTFESDKKRQDDKKIVYEDYSSISSDLSEPKFSRFAVEEGSRYSIYNDSAKNRIIYSVPFTGKNDRNIQNENCLILFYCQAGDFVRYLFSKNIITLSEKDSAEFLVLNDNNSAYVFGLPYRNLDLSKTAVEALKGAIAEKLNSNTGSTLINEQSIFMSGAYRLVDRANQQGTELNTGELSQASTEEESAGTELVSEHGWILFSKLNSTDSKNANFIGFVYDDDIFTVGLGIRVLLLVLFFITLFLLVFLAFNLRHDDMVVIKDRIRRFQLAFITEYINGQDGDLKALPQNITNRKEALSDEIRASLGSRGKKHREEVDALLERNWTQILASLGSHQVGSAGVKAAIDSVELRRVLEDVLGSGTLKIQAAQVTGAAVQPAPATVSSAVEEAEELDEAESVDAVEEAEELEVAEPVEEAEELDEAEPIEDAEELDEAEPVEEVEELDEAEPIEEAEELDEAEPADVVEEAEDLEDAEPVDVVEEADELEDAEPVDVVEDAEELDEAEPVDVVEEAEELDEAEPVDVVEEAEDLEDAEPVDAVEEAEELDEAEPIEEAEELEGAEPIEEAEELEVAEPVDVVDEAEELDEAEPVEEAEELEDAEPVDVVEEAEELDEAEPVDAVEEAEELDEAEPIEEPEELDEVEPASAVSESLDAEDMTEEFQEFADNANKEPSALSVDNDEIEEEQEFGSPLPEQTVKPEDEKYVESFAAGPMDFSFLDEQPPALEVEEPELPVEDVLLSDIVQEEDAVSERKMPVEEDVPVEEDAPVEEEIEDIPVEEEIEDVPVEEEIPAEEDAPVDDDAPAEEEIEDAEEIESLENDYASHPFLFAGLAKNNNNIKYLEADNSNAIVQSEDGTFHIQGLPGEKDVAIDVEFKKLVDSVLN